MIRRRRVLLLPAIGLTYCSGPKPPPTPPPPPVVTLTMIGGTDQNPDAAGKAAPVAVRIYQLTQTAKFERNDVFALTEHEQQTLGQDDVASQEIVLSPGETQTQSFEPKPGVQAVGIVVLYRDIDAAQWRVDAPVADRGATKLTLNVGKLAITLKPG